MADQDLIAVLREISARIKGIESTQEELKAIVVEQASALSDLRTAVLDDADRHGAQTKRNTGAIQKIDSRVTKLERLNPALPKGPVNGSGSAGYRH